MIADYSIMISVEATSGKQEIKRKLKKYSWQQTQMPIQYLDTSGYYSLLKRENEMVYDQDGIAYQGDDMPPVEEVNAFHDRCDEVDPDDAQLIEAGDWYLAMLENEDSDLEDFAY